MAWAARPEPSGPAAAESRPRSGAPAEQSMAQHLATPLPLETLKDLGKGGYPGLRNGWELGCPRW